jgi:lycopene cyclase domain-containing protein
VGRQSLSKEGVPKYAFLKADARGGYRVGDTWKEQVMAGSSSKTSDFSVVLAMLGMVAAPAALALSRVRPATVPNCPSEAPLGYTVSLLFFIFPIGVLLIWLLPHERLKLPRKAFGMTVGILVPAGFLLEYFCATTFFRFPNPEATLQVHAPALGGTVPLEEYAFYLSGFTAILIIYLWLGEYWFEAYNVPDYPAEAQKLDRLLRFHPGATGLGVALLAMGILYKKFFAADRSGFPGYFTVLVLLGFVPAAGFFQAAKPLINWRALGLTLFFVLFISLLWETTLAIPYGYWNYQDRQMVGILIRAWGGLPIEAVFVWIAVTFATAIVFEIVKLWQASGKRLRHAFLGQQKL